MPLDPKQQPPYYTSATQSGNAIPKQYIAIVTQSGTSAPVSTIQKNTYNSTPIWSRVNVGIYRLTFPEAELTTKTTTPPTTGTNTGASIGLWGALPLDHCYQVVKLSTTIIELTVNAVATGDNVEISTINADILLTINTYE